MVQPFTGVTRAGLLCALLLILGTTAMFACSVVMRARWLQPNPVRPETWISSVSLLRAREWYREGPVHLRFGLLCDPDSIETPTLASREVYSSYPPAAILPAYLLGKALQREPTLGQMTGIGLANQLLLALLLEWMLFGYLRRAGWPHADACLPALTPALLLFFLPAPAFLFPTAQVPDLAVLPLFAAYVGIEFLRDGVSDARKRTWISGVQAVIAFWGILFDWLFAFVALCTYVKRLAGGDIAPCSRQEVKGWPLRFLRRSAQFWFPYGVAMTLFAVQLHYFGQFHVIAERFRERAGITGGMFLALTLKNRFWRGHMVRGYGITGEALLGVCVAGFAILLACAALRPVLRKQPYGSLNTGLGLMWILMTPCLLHTLAFAQHGSNPFHFMTAAKYAIPIATIPFVILPVTVAGCFRRTGSTETGARRGLRHAASMAIAVLAFGYVCTQHPRMMAASEPVASRDTLASGQFLARNTTYNDVVFTADATLASNISCVQDAQSMKHVYLASTLHETFRRLREVQGEYVVNWFVSAGGVPIANSQIRQLMDAAYDCASSEDLRLFKVRKESFLALCRKGGADP